MQMKFWILLKLSQVIFCQAIKETKQAYISNYISYFLNTFLESLFQQPSYMFAIRLFFEDLSFHFFCFLGCWTRELEGGTIL